MKILIVDAYYPRFLEHALGQMNIDTLGYQEMLAALLRLRFGTADFYSRNLRQLGYEADDIIFNCGPLQQRWAEEHGAPLIGSTSAVLSWAYRLPVIRRRVGQRRSLLDIALRQIRHARPDVLYLQNLELFPPAVLQDLKQSMGLFIVGQIASPLPEQGFIKAFDLILTSFPHFVSRFRSMGIRSEYLRIGFDPIVLEELGEVKRHRLCTFVGGISPAHWGRWTLLESLARAVDLEVFGYGAETLPSSSAIVARHRGEAWAMDMYRVLAESWITVNTHIDVAENYANNMRLYEATGCGALLVTDHKDNLDELFRPGVEIVSYQNVEEAIDRIRYFCNHLEEASQIARAGQARTLREHTYHQRMEELVDILGKHFKEKRT